MKPDRMHWRKRCGAMLFASRMRDSLFLKLLVGFACVWTLLYMFRDHLSDQTREAVRSNRQFARYLQSRGQPAAAGRVGDQPDTVRKCPSASLSLPPS